MSYLTNPYRYAVTGGVWYDTLTNSGEYETSISSGANLYRGECAVTASSTMIGKKITVAIVPMKTSDVLTGNVTFGIYNSSAVLQETIGIIVADTITGTKANYTFTGSGGSYAIQEGDFIMAGYTTEGGSLSVEVYATDGQEYDGQDSRRAYYESGSMQYTGAEQDFVMSLSDA